MEWSNFTEILKIIAITAPILIIIGIAVRVLSYKNKKITEEVTIQKNKRDKYRNGIKKIRKLDDLNERLYELDFLAQEFMKERLEIYKIDYFKISSEAKKGSNLEKFTKMMVNIKYKDLPITEKRMDAILLLFSEMVSGIA